MFFFHFSTKLLMSYQQSISCKGLHLHPIYNSAHVIDCALYSFRARQAVDSEQLSVTAQNKVRLVS